MSLKEKIGQVPQARTQAAAAVETTKAQLETDNTTAISTEEEKLRQLMGELLPVTDAIFAEISSTLRAQLSRTINVATHPIIKDGKVKGFNRKTTSASLSYDHEEPIPGQTVWRQGYSFKLVLGYTNEESTTGELNLYLGRSVGRSMHAHSGTTQIDRTTFNPSYFREWLENSLAGPLYDGIRNPSEAAYFWNSTPKTFPDIDPSYRWREDDRSDDQYSD